MSHLTSHSIERGNGRARVYTVCLPFFSVAVKACGARSAFLIWTSLSPPRPQPLPGRARHSPPRVRARCRGWSQRREADTRTELHRRTCQERLAKPSRWPKQGPMRRTRRPHLAKLRERPHGDRSGAHGTRSKPGLEKMDHVGTGEAPMARLACGTSHKARMGTECARGATAHVGTNRMMQRDAAQGTRVRIHQKHFDEDAHRVHILWVCGRNLHSQCVHACNRTKHGVGVLRTGCDNQASLKVLAMGTYEKQNLKKKTARGVKPMTQQVTS